MNFKPSQAGTNGGVINYNPLTSKIKKQEAGETFGNQLGPDHHSYYMVAPATAGGITFLGEYNKNAGMGKKKIAEMRASGNQLQLKVLLAKTEEDVQLHDYYTNFVKSVKGKLIGNKENQPFSLNLPAPKNGDEVNFSFTGGS